MKYLLFLPPIVLFSCAPVMTTDHSGAGEVDTSGKAIGNWTLFSDANSSVFAKGAYLNGKPHGPWEVWDDSGIKNAELDFEYGKCNGGYQLYYTGFTPEAEGALKTVGRVYEGIFSGDFTRYDVNGRVLVNYTAIDNSITTVQEGLRVDAEEQLAADMALLKIYTDAILGAQYNRTEADYTYGEEPVNR